MSRLFDICASVIGLLVTGPLCLLIALTVVLESGNPALFSQVRVGRGGRLFRIYKFRTMRTGQAGTLITVAGDSRITQCGAALRASKLDELPQFWNVLRGDMAIVGPRPELPAVVNRFAEQYAVLLKVRPGIVDPASLAFQDEEVRLAGYPDPTAAYFSQILPEKLAMSAQYLSTRNWQTDFGLVLRTVFLMGKSFPR